MDKFIISANQFLKLKMFTPKGTQLDEKYFTLPNLAREKLKDVRIQPIDVVALMNDEESLQQFTERVRRDIENCY